MRVHSWMIVITLLTWKMLRMLRMRIVIINWKKRRIVVSELIFLNWIIEKCDWIIAKG
jgi:hypothetical protein